MHEKYNYEKKNLSLTALNGSQFEKFTASAIWSNEHQNSFKKKIILAPSGSCSFAYDKAKITRRLEFSTVWFQKKSSKNICGTQISQINGVQNRVGAKLLGSQPAVSFKCFTTFNFLETVVDLNLEKYMLREDAMKTELIKATTKGHLCHPQSRHRNRWWHHSNTNSSIKLQIAKTHCGLWCLNVASFQKRNFNYYSAFGNKCDKFVIFQSKAPRTSSCR